MTGTIVKSSTKKVIGLKGNQKKLEWLNESKNLMQIETMEEHCQNLIKYYFDIIVLSIEKKTYYHN